MSTIKLSTLRHLRSIHVGKMVLVGLALAVPTIGRSQVPSSGNTGATSGTAGPNLGSNTGPNIGSNLAPNAGPNVGSATPNIGPNAASNLGPNTAGQITTPPATSGGQSLPEPTLNPGGNSVTDPNRTLPALPPANRAVQGVPPALDSSSNFAPSLATDLGMRFTPSRVRLQLQNLDSESLSARAGFRAGDEILAVNRSWIRSRDQLFGALGTAASSDGRAWVLVNRGGRRMWVNLPLSSAPRANLGIVINDSSGAVRIREVTHGSAAERAGLRSGDEVISANGAAIRSSDELIASVRSAAASDGRILLTVRRNGTEEKIEATLPNAVNAVQNVSTPAETPVGNANRGDNQSRGPAIIPEGIAQAQSTAANLKQAVDALAASATEPLRDKVEQIRDKVGDIQQAVNSLVQNDMNRSVERIVRLRAEIRSLQSQFSALAREASGDFKTRVESARDSAVQLEQNLTDAPQANAERFAGRVNEATEPKGTASPANNNATPTAPARRP